MVCPIANTGNVPRESTLIATSHRPGFIVGPPRPAAIESAVAAGGGRVVEDPADAEAVIWMNRDMDALLSLLHNGIRWVQLPDAGIERWIEAGLLDRVETVTAARAIYGPQVAEHALALILACCRHLGACARATTWYTNELRGIRLAGQLVAVVGVGGIGQSLLRLLHAVGARTLAVNRDGRAVQGADQTLPITQLGQAMALADTVVLCLPSTPQTVKLIDAKLLAQLRPSAYLVNVGRGDVLDTDALVAALNAEAFAGAALDVTDPEPLPDGHPLWRHPRVLITPHTANPSASKLASYVDFVEQNCRRFADGQTLIGIVNRGSGY